MDIKKLLKNEVVKEVIDWVVHVFFAIAIGIFIVKYVVQVTIVHGSSMERCLHNGNRVIVEKFIFKRTGIKRGDIVTINKPRDLENEKTPVIKRVVAIAGDEVEIKEGNVYVNGEKINEPYINGTYTHIICEEYQKLVVPYGKIYVLGDNRLPNASMDSRSYGPVSTKKVEGRAILRFYPFKQFGRLKVK